MPLRSPLTPAQAFARAINPRLQANEAWSWKTTTPGLLGHAVRTYGWSFIPKQVIPPLFANIVYVICPCSAGPRAPFSRLMMRCSRQRRLRAVRVVPADVGRAA